MFEDATTCERRRLVGPVRNGFNKIIQISADTDTAFQLYFPVGVKDGYEKKCDGMFSFKPENNNNYLLNIISLDSHCEISLINNNTNTAIPLTKRKAVSEYLIFSQNSSYCKPLNNL